MGGILVQYSTVLGKGQVGEFQLPRRGGLPDDPMTDEGHWETTESGGVRRAYPSTGAAANFTDTL